MIYVYERSVLWKITTTTLITILLLTTLTPTTQAQTQNQTWKKQILQKGFLETGPHGIALDTWNYLLGQTKKFTDHFTLHKNLTGTKKENTASIYGHAQTIKKAEQTTHKIQKNHIHDARNLAWAKIKKHTLQALKNNRTKQYTKVHTTRIIKNYYSTIQYNLNQQLNTQIKTLKHLTQKNQNTTTLHQNPFQIQATVKYTSWGNTHTLTPTKNLVYQKTNTTLINGTKHQVHDIKPIQIPKRSYSHGQITIDAAPYGDQKPVQGDAQNQKVGIYVKGAINDKALIIDTNSWRQIHSKLKQEKDRMIDNAKNYIDGVYNQSQTQNIKTKNLIDASTLVSTLNTKINKTGYLGYSNAKLALLGINTSLDAKIKIKLTKTNQSLTGMLYTDHIPKNNSFSVGEKYYPTNWSEPCYFLSSFHTIQQPFQIQKITSKKGETVTEIGLENYNRQTLDPNNLETELKQLNKLYNQTKDYEEKNTSLEIKDLFNELNPEQMDLNHWYEETIFLALLIGFLLAILLVRW